MKRVLILLPFFPYPLSSGGEIAIHNSLLAVKDCVELFCIYTIPFYKKKDLRQREKESRIENVTFIQYHMNPLKDISNTFIRRIEHFIKKIRRYKDGFDYSCYEKSQEFLIDVTNQKYIDFVNHIVNKYHIDIVQIEMNQLPIVLTLPSNVKKIFIHHELRFVINSLQIQMMKKTPYRLANGELSKICEIGLLNKCDAVVTLSDIDRRKLINEGVCVPVYTSFAVVNECNNINPNKEDLVLSFVGPSIHSPNCVGLKWFLENCWSDLSNNNPSYHLKIIGNWSEDKRNEILQKYKNVEFLGYVPNLADALNNTIMIVPITVGSGIRMKILEAASLGIPFVSTTVGAEGLPFESGIDCFKADSPETFVKAITDLKDKSLREKFTQNARAIVKEKYSMEALQKNRLIIYEKVLGLK